MKKAIALAGLFYGDEGKGTMTDFLVRHHEATLVVRYNGGPQAAHNVLTDDGLHHTFSQLGSGSFAGAETYLSQYMLVDPLALQNELIAFRNTSGNWILDKIWISPRALVITPYHRYLNQARELLRDHRHGSVGLGIGEARRLEAEGKAIYIRDLKLSPWPSLKDRLLELQQLIIGEIEQLPGDSDIKQTYIERAQAVHAAGLMAAYRGIGKDMRVAAFDEIAKAHKVVVFEGAQGVMLDETYGWAPYNTWTDCTWGNVDRLLSTTNIIGLEIERIAVMRTFLTRHGAGPLLTEDPTLNHFEPHNKTHPFMGPIRFGHFDLSLARIALSALGDIDGFALTHMDFPVEKICVGYSYNAKETEAFAGTENYLKQKPLYAPATTASLVPEILNALGKPILYTSHGPHPKQKAVATVTV